MKRMYLWLIPCAIVAVCLVGFVVGLIIKNNQQDKKIYAQSIEFKYEKLQLEKEETYEITREDFIIKPANCNQKVLLSTNDTNMLLVDPLTGEILTKQAGSCKLFASIKSSEKDVLQIEINVEITEPEKPQRQVNLNFNLADGLAVINFTASSSFADYISPTVVDGAANLDIVDFELGKITIMLKQTGSATICLENSVEKVLYVIEIS